MVAHVTTRARLRGKEDTRALVLTTILEATVYTRIFVPLDGSDLAAQALPYARVFATTLNAQVELFQSIPTLPALMQDLSIRRTLDDTDSWEGNVRPSPTLDEWQGFHLQLRQAIERDLEQAAAGLRTAGISVHTTVREGSPAESIVETAGKDPTTLILMSTHGRSGIMRWWAGSVTDRTVRTAECPVLVVRCDPRAAAPQEPQVHKVILPLDGSPLAEQAIPHATALAKALHAPVTILRARPRPYYIPARFPAPGGAPSPHTMDPNAEEYINQAVEQIKASGITDVEGRVADGDAGAIISEAAETSPDGLVVMSTHGRSGIGRWVLGSVADKVVRHGGCPVLLVRAREEAAQQAA